MFSRFAYKDGNQELCFVIQRADTEKDNAKGSAKYFFPAAWQAVDDGFELAWTWRAATDAENRRYKAKGGATAAGPHEAQATGEASAEAIGTGTGATMQERVLDAWLAGSDFKSAKVPKGVNTVLLATNARRFVRKNTSDFFVHPQLGEFLRGELDVYLKHEFVQIWHAPDSELPRIRAKFQLVRDIALDLITFLDQIERFQATLFEKRKFVLQADYLVQCSWLQREAGATGQKLVAEACANTHQAKEWASWVGDAAKKPHGKKLLAQYPHLPLHTRHFSAAFKARVLACFDDLEAALGGELVHADNYAALRTLEPAYRERVQCIYIDPPYNTGGDGFLYKDEFTRHSAWASLMDTRLRASRDLLASQGVLFGSIDDKEHNTFRNLLDRQFGAENFVADVIWQKKYAPQNDATWFSDDHDYLLCFAKDKANWLPAKLPRADKQDRLFTNPDGDRRGPWMSGDYTSNKSAQERPRLFYAVRNPISGAEVLPGRGRVWAYSREQHEQNVQDNRVWWGESGQLKAPRYKRFLSEVGGLVPRTVWLHDEVGHNQEAIQLLRGMFDDGMAFTAPKPPRLIERCVRIGAGSITLDYFAGSGTTGHAVVNLNREDGGTRKFLLVEQGDYFDTVTLPRIAKVLAAPDWKDGKPKDTVQHDDAGDPDHWSRRTLPLVRVLRLERYEDSLDALEFRPAAQADQAQRDMELVATDAQEHLLRYWLIDTLEGDSGQAVRLSTDKLSDPFDYRLTLHEPTGPRPADVDLLETARLLLGLVPKRMRDVVDAQGQRHQLMEAVPAGELARGVPNPRPVLLWLRTVHDERTADAAEAEHAWLSDTVQSHFGHALKDYATVFHNRAAFWPVGERGSSIDSLLAASMMERAR